MKYAFFTKYLYILNFLILKFYLFNRNLYFKIESSLFKTNFISNQKIRFLFNLRPYILFKIIKRY